MTATECEIPPYSSLSRRLILCLLFNNCLERMNMAMHNNLCYDKMCNEQLLCMFKSLEDLINAYNVAS